MFWENVTCPLCGKPYTGYPALSRLDNKTGVCNDCGVWEAFHNGLIQELVAQKFSKGAAFDIMRMHQEEECRHSV